MGCHKKVVATMLSLASTHVILHHHRKVHYHQITTDTSAVKTSLKELGGLSNGFMIFALASLVISMSFYIAGVILDSFEVTSTRGETSITNVYSILSIGMSIPDAYVDPDHAGTSFIQFMWFYLGIVEPVFCSIIFFVLYALPSLSKATMKELFKLAEIAFAWR